MPENIAVTTNQTKWKTVVTDTGKAKMARAALDGRRVNIVEAAVTDGGGRYFLPTADMTALPGTEVWRGPIQRKEINGASPNVITVTVFLDGTVGGWTARGVGLFDDEGDLIALGNMPDTAKALLVDGAAATLTLLVRILVTDVDVLEFKIDPALDTVKSSELAAALDRQGQTLRGERDDALKLLEERLTLLMEKSGMALVIGDEEPEGRRVLWFDTGFGRKRTSSVTLALGGEGDESDVSARIDGRDSPVTNAGVESAGEDGLVIRIFE